ncbi:hypothetical protein [Rhodococcus pyridinivorans]|uniref:hypothetical protein n=1 Tax=Rhodococcus pyridinivorans TaxID=103816 RepID=UPI0022848005|nr:hypothetical protein [Rhodococcus pyridinivorans]WAL49577.1 hypothetical protein OQN32_27630 [Rhodococcus pyridinivorans]
MVCRENKGRSFVIGFTKALQRQMGGDAFHDAEVQSSQHEFKHQLEDMNRQFTEDPEQWRNTQIKVWESVRQNVADSTAFSDEAKYRVSPGRGGQPGFITRIDQELERLKSGKDEHGRPLRPEQMNSPAELASIMRMGSILERIGPAKNNFLEMNARHRGISMDDARREWNQLMNRKGDFSNISLTDDYRNSMAGAGITARDQSDLGISGRARDSMRIMEQRRLQAVHALETRPAIRTEHKLRTFIDPKSEAAQIRCEKCGQFGHHGGGCPNGDILKKKQSLQQQSDILARTAKASQIRKMLGRPDEELQASMDTHFPGQYADVSAFRAVQEKRIDGLLAGNPEMDDDELRDAQRQISRQEKRLNKELEARGGTTSWIKEVHYNPENGLLVVRPHDYTTKDGQTKQARPFMRRVSPENVQAMLDSDESFGKAINDLGMIRGPQLDNYGFENQDDYAESLVQRKCPTCGQFASMNTGHRCPVPGSPSEEYKARELAASSAYRTLLAQTKGKTTPGTAKPMHRRQAFQAESRTVRIRGANNQPVEGKIVTARAADVIGTSDAGHIANPAVRASYPDATVTGTVAVWEDLDGRRVISPFSTAGGRGLKCSCEDYAQRRWCRHLAGTSNALARKYEASNAGKSQPGGPTASDNTAADAPIGAQNRLSYGRIQKMRSGATAEFVEAYKARPSNGVSMAAPAAMPPRDIEGNPIPEPDQWTRSEAQTSRLGKPVDLNDTKQVTHRVRKLLAGRPPRVSFSVRPDKDGGITVDIPPIHRGTPQEAYYRKELGNLLGTPALKGRRGFYIPPTPSARFAALERAAGDPVRIRPSEWVTRIDPERDEMNQQRHRATRGQNNQGADPAITGQHVGV